MSRTGFGCNSPGEHHDLTYARTTRWWPGVHVKLRCAPGCIVVFAEAFAVLTFALLVVLAPSIASVSVCGINGP